MARGNEAHGDCRQIVADTALTVMGVERRTTNLREVHVMDSDSPKQLDDHHQPIPLTSDTDASCTRQSYFIR
jgi:hypothetical protein